MPYTETKSALACAQIILSGIDLVRMMRKQQVTYTRNQEPGGPSSLLTARKKCRLSSGLVQSF